MKIPKEYQWIKPGAVGLYPSRLFVTKFISEPYLSDSFLEPMWFADTEMGGVHLDGWIDARKIPSEFAALSKARALVTEYKDAIKRAKRLSKSVPKDSIFFQLTEESKALVALADALESK